MTTTLLPTLQRRRIFAGPLTSTPTLKLNPPTLSYNKRQTQFMSSTTTIYNLFCWSRERIFLCVMVNGHSFLVDTDRPVGDVIE
jgi:hypothetical protein